MGAELAIDAAKEAPQGRHVVTSVSKLVREKMGMTLKGYCEQRNISYSSLRVGFISKSAAEKLMADGLI